MLRSYLSLLFIIIDIIKRIKKILHTRRHEKL